MTTELDCLVKSVTHTEEGRTAAVKIIKVKDCWSIPVPPDCEPGDRIKISVEWAR